MNFVFNTVYDMDALTVMARAVRKTTHKKRSKRSHIFGLIVIAVAAVVVAVSVMADKFSFNMFITALAAVVMLMALVFEDRLNAYFSSKRMIKGSEKAVVTFNDDNYISSTEVGTTEFKYDIIEAPKIILRRQVMNLRHYIENPALLHENRLPPRSLLIPAQKSGITHRNYQVAVSRVTDRE